MKKTNTNFMIQFLAPFVFTMMLLFLGSTILHAEPSSESVPEREAGTHVKRLSDDNDEGSTVIFGVSPEELNTEVAPPESPKYTCIFRNQYFKKDTRQNNNSELRWDILIDPQSMKQ